MSDWLRLTEEDIANIEAETRSRPRTPAALTLHDDEMAADAPTTPVRSHTLRLTSADLAPVAPKRDNTHDLTQLETLMFGLTNQARQAELPRWLGDRKLRWDDRVSAVARGHAFDMLKRSYVDHTTPEGVSVAERIKRHQISYAACGENIGVVYGPASQSDEGIYEIQRAFMSQPRRLTNHRGNLLNPVWTHVGIGVARNDSGTLVMVQNFIAAFG